MCPIWNSPPITEQPEYRLVDWCIFETDRGERHFLGYSLDSRDGRVSSAIETFDTTARIGVTRSGRVYRLGGNPGRNPDAYYVWGVWIRVNNVTSWRDVTDEVCGS